MKRRKRREKMCENVHKMTWILWQRRAMKYETSHNSLYVSVRNFYDKTHETCGWGFLYNRHSVTRHKNMHFKKNEGCAQGDQDAVTKKGGIYFTFFRKRVEVNCLRGGCKKRIGCLCLFFDSQHGGYWLCESFLITCVFCS